MIYQENFHSPLLRIFQGSAFLEPKEVKTFCEACSPPRVAHYEGRNLVLRRVDCSCQCSETIFEQDGPRCPKCNHLVKIQLTDQWVDPFLWIDPKTGEPVRIDEIQPSN